MMEKKKKPLSINIKFKVDEDDPNTKIIMKKLNELLFALGVTKKENING